MRYRWSPAKSPHEKRPTRTPTRPNEGTSDVHLPKSYPRSRRIILVKVRNCRRFSSAAAAVFLLAPLKLSADHWEFPGCAGQPRVRIRRMAAGTGACDIINSVFLRIP